MLVAQNGAYIHPDYYELAEFFGREMRWDWLGAGDEKGEVEAARYTNNEDFMRHTGVFCFQNVGLMTQGIHRPYIARMLDATRDMGPVRFIDVGAGGGQLGLAMHTLGFEVSFADIQSVSLIYLVWRLHRRGLNLPVYSLDGNPKIPRQQMAACFDVLEHLGETEQGELLKRLDEMADLVFVNLIHDRRPGMAGVHFEVSSERIGHLVGPHSLEDFYPDKDGLPRQSLLVYGKGIRAL